MPKRKLPVVRRQKKRPRFNTFTGSMSSTGALVARGAYEVGRQAYSRYVAGQKAKKKVSTGTQTIVKRKRDKDSGGYTQWDTFKRKDKLSVDMSLVKQMKRILKSNEEKLIFRWNGVKSFDDHGYYWLRNNTINGVRYMPLYFYDLTSCVNSTQQGVGVPTILHSEPLTRCYVNSAGSVYFEHDVCYKADGSTTTSELQIERGSYGGGVDGTGLNHILPHNKDILKWVSIKMNCWGAKARSTKFTVSIVRFKDEVLQPTPFLAPNEKRTGLFQSILKPISFNPVSTTGSDMRKFLKVLRTETFIIQPTSTTESDQDPHVRTLKWFCRFNRLIDYVQRENSLNTKEDVADQADYAINIGNQNAAYANATKRLYLMISATNYGKDGEDDTSPTNVETPSFDLSVRTCHTTMA